MFSLRRIIPIVLGAVALLACYAAPASAQATRTWVSGVGDDANPCSRTAPCKTFAGAISKTAAGGEINCLDPGGFGALTITKAITLQCDGTMGSVLVAGTNGIVVAAGPTDQVTINGLEIEGLKQTGNGGLNGLRFISGAALFVHKVQIRNFNNSGIDIEPSASAKIYIDECYITDDGTAAPDSGILIKPTGSATINFSVNRSQVEGDAFGIRADSSATSGQVRGVVRDTLVSGSANNGITAVATSSTTIVLIDHSTIANNNFGLVVNGATAFLETGYSSVTGNNTGLFQNGSGHLYSYKNNLVNGNVTTDGAFTDFFTAE